MMYVQGSLIRYIYRELIALMSFLTLNLGAMIYFTIVFFIV